MAQQFQQRRRRSSSSSGSYDEAGNADSTPFGVAGSNAVSDGAQGQLDDIDSLLAQNDAVMSSSQGLDSDKLRSSEEDAADDKPSVAVDPKEGYKAGFGYSDEDKANARRQKAKNKSKGGFFNKNKKYFLGGGAGAGIAGLVLSFTLLLPLKVQHIAENLQKHFFASAEQATDDLTDRLLGQYLVQKVMPGMRKATTCTSTAVNRSCAVHSEGSGPVSRLYNAWRDANFEGKLAEKQGIEIRREGNKFYMRAGGKDLFSGIEFDERNPKLFEKKMYSEMSKNDIRKEMRKAFQNETFAKRIFYRYKVGTLLERKYNIKRCLVACEYRDKRQEKKADKKEMRKLRWKYFLIDRVTTQRTEMLSLALKCAISDSFRCTDIDNTESNGERTSKYERDLKDRLRTLNLDKPKLAQLNETADSIRKKGLTGHIVSKMINETAGKIVGSSIPVIGWINTAATMITVMKNAGPAVKKLNYITNSQTMVTMYMMYRTSADEIKTGEADAEDIGTVASSLGKDVGSDQNGASAEESPIYQEIMGSKSIKTASIFNGFMPKAEAFNGYKCNDGSTIVTGVCPEVTLAAAGAIADIASFTSTITGYLGPLASVAEVWSSTIGGIFSYIGNLASPLLELVPGYNQLVAAAEPIIAAIGKWFASKVIKDIMGENPSGGRMFEVAAGGADVSGNSYAHYGLGAQEISDSTASEIRASRQKQELEEFKSQGFFARMFDTSSDLSFVSKMAMAMPSSSTDMVHSMGTTILNPFSRLSVPSFGNQRAVAASTKDPYGVTQYGYNPDDPVFKTDDLETFWEQNDCGNPDKAKQWGETSVDNPDTGMPENKTANPCALIDTSVSMSGAIYDDSFLTAEELGNGGGSGTTTADIKFTVASYNVLHATAFPRTLCNANEPTVGNFSPDCVNRRSELQSKIISGGSGAGSPQFDIVGLQELSPPQLESLKKNLTGYASFPDQVPDNHGVGLFWNSDKFTKIESGFAPGRNNVGAAAQIPWVGLKSVTGQKIYAMSVHYANSDCADGNCSTQSPTTNATNTANMKASAQLTVDWVKTKVAGDSPVVVVGDFNDKLSEKLSYCEFTKGGLMQHAVDMVAGAAVDAGCNQNRYDSIDHIYATPVAGITASGWTDMPDSPGALHQASDHQPSYVTYEIPGVSSGAGGNFTISTFNVLGAGHTGGNFEGRADKSLAVIRNNQIDVSGMQEFTLKQRRYFLQQLGNFDSFPKGNSTNQNAIIWNNTRFSLVDSGIIPDVKYFCASGSSTPYALKAPWIRLKITDTGQEIYVLNTHDPASSGNNACAGSADLYRYQNAKQYVEFLKSIQGDGIPIFFTGDFNSSYKANNTGNNTYQGKDENTIYCIVAGSGIMDDAYDLAKKRPYKCPNPKERADRENDANGIDHVFVSKGVQVTGYTKEGYPANGADHPTQIFKVALPGSSGSTGGVSTPGTSEMGDDYKTECSRYTSCSKQCVDFVKFRLKKHIDRNKFADFTTGVGGVAASTSAVNLKRLYGYKVDSNAAVNSVAVWPAGGVTGSHANDTYGHVAMVSQVNSDGSIIVEEYNVRGPVYSKRTLSKAVAKRLTYAHTEVDYK